MLCYTVLQCYNVILCVSILFYVLLCCFVILYCCLCITPLSLQKLNVFGWNKNNKILQDITTTLLQIHNIILNEAITIGTLLEIWLIPEAIMIKKEPNNPKIDKLRVIDKIKVDWNLVLKYHCPHLFTQYVEENHMLGKNQRGVRSRRRVNTTVLLDEVIMEIHSPSFYSLVKLQNDVAICYDRRIRNILDLYYRHHGVPDSVYLLQATTLRNMRHQVPT